MTSHGQPRVVRKQSGYPKAELHAHSYQQPLRAFKLLVVSMATSLQKRVHASTSIIRTPTKSRPLPLVGPPTRTLCETVGAQSPCARDQGLARAGVSNG